MNPSIWFRFDSIAVNFDSIRSDFLESHSPTCSSGEVCQDCQDMEKKRKQTSGNLLQKIGQQISREISTIFTPCSK